MYTCLSPHSADYVASIVYIFLYYGYIDMYVYTYHMYTLIGNIFHSLGLHQLGYMRPAPGYSNHRTPIKGLYLCSAGSHPGGGVQGAPGRNCAQIVGFDLGR